MPVQTKPCVTPEEYLALERKAEHKSEYYAGEIVAMSGASRQHNRMVTDMVRELSFQLKGRRCEVYSNDMRVKVSPTGLYTYPDVVIVCGPAQCDDAQSDTLLNPTVIIEVLSESTEAYDRGKTFEHYCTLASLSDYILVAQDKPKMEHYGRQPEGRWLFSEKHGRAETRAIESVGCTLALAEVYDKVEYAE